MSLRIEQLFIRYRIVLLGIVVLMTSAAVIGIMRLEFDDVPRSVFRIEDKDFERLESVFANFGSDDNDCLLVVQPASAKSLSQNPLPSLEGESKASLSPNPLPSLEGESKASLSPNPLPSLEGESKVSLSPNPLPSLEGESKVSLSSNPLHRFGGEGRVRGSSSSGIGSNSNSVESGGPSRSDHLFTPATASALRRVVTELKKIEGIESVRSLLDVVTISAMGRMSSILPAEDEVSEEVFQQARQAAVSHPLALGQLISSDAATSLIVVRMPEGTVRIGDIQPYLQAIGQAIQRAGVEQELWIRLTGVPTIRVEIYDMVRRETRRFVVLGVLLASCMSLMLFRRPWPVLIVSLAPMLGSLWTLGAMGLLGQKMNIINTIVPTLVMIVGFTDAVHLMHHLREAIGAGASPLAAAGLTVRHLWKACLMTSLTTAVGFGSLVVAQVEIIRSFGAVCAMGSMLAFLAVILVVPLLASTPLGNRLAHVRPPNPNGWTARCVDWAVDQVLRHYRVVTVAGVLATIVMFIATLYLRPDNRLTESIPDSTPSAQALAHCDRVLGGILMGYALVEWDERYDLKSPELISVLESAQQLLDQEPGTSYPMSVINLLRILPGKSDDLSERVPLLSWVPKDVTRRFVRSDLRQALISVHLPDVGTSKHLAAFEHLEKEFANISQRYPGIQVNLTGSVAVAGRNINLMIVDLANSILTASIIIFGCLAIGFRSWLYGLISILPNVFPLVLTGTVLVVLGSPLQLIGVIVFSICLGIAVDDTIHFLARFQRELLVDQDVPAAVRRAFHAVGGALVTTTLVLLAGFGVVLTSEMPSSRQFAWMSCTAILAALVGDLLILPSLLAWFAKPDRLAPSNRSTPSE